MKKKRAKSVIPKPGDRIYFNQDTEDAIVRYNKSTDPIERERIYKTHLEYPFDKMAENIINKYKFTYIKYGFDDIKKQVVAHLVMNLGKYTADKGKAFSYFSVIAKNWLILKNNTEHKEEKRTISLSEISGDDAVTPIEEIISTDYETTERHEETKEFIQLLIEYWDDNLYRIFKKKRDREIANAVIELFRRSDGIETFNKKTLYLLIREQTDHKTSYITKVVNKMKILVAQQLKDYYEYGIIGYKEDKFFKYR